MANRTCSVEGCSRKHAAHGYCYAHYRKARRRGEFGLCSVEGCSIGRDRGGMCVAHYGRKYRGKVVEGPVIKQWHDQLRESIETGDDAATLSKVKARCQINPTTACWEYFRANGKGYGEVAVGKRTVLTHRLIARICLPDFAPHLQVHHKCANRICCNPDHLQVLTSRENRAEMLERNTYLKRIAALEDALRKAAPSHPLLVD